MFRSVKVTGIILVRRTCNSFIILFPLERSRLDPWVFICLSGKIVQAIQHCHGSTGFTCLFAVCLQNRHDFFARTKASVKRARSRARLETRVTEGARGKARFFFLRLHLPRVSAAPCSLRAYLRSPEQLEKVTLVMLAPKRDRMFAAEILLRERIFRGKSDACN